LLLIKVCYYYMLVHSKFHWYISFQKKLPSKYVVKNARSVRHFMWQTFFPNKFQGFVKLKILNIIYKNKMVTLKNLILKYIGIKNINILKRKWHVGINVVFLEVILKLCDVCFMKNIFIASWTCLHCFDLHIIIRWPKNVRRVNKIL
jgi:hypothetical protein